jgi:hypothetical protein
MRCNVQKDKKYIFSSFVEENRELMGRVRPTLARLIKVSFDQLTSIMRECVSTFAIAYEIPLTTSAARLADRQGRAVSARYHCWRGISSGHLR